MTEETQNGSLIEAKEDSFRTLENMKSGTNDYSLLKTESSPEILSISTTGSGSVSIMGSPLQASSPLASISQPSLGIDERGDGDCQAVPSFQDLISPIRRSGGNHQIRLGSPNFNASFPSLDTSLNNQSAPLDKLLADFQQRKPFTPMKKSPPPPNHAELERLAEKIATMEEEEAKKLLTKLVKHNMDLRQELRNKEKRITAFKSQMLAILEWKAKQEMDAFSEDSSTDRICNSKLSKSKSRRNGKIRDSDEKDTSSDTSDSVETERKASPQRVGSGGPVQSVTVVEEVFSIRRSLSLIQELASTIDIDQDLLRYRIKEGCHLTNQLLVGGLSGYASALFLKKFGKLALSAACGGLALLIYSTRKGYVNVNYESIYQELSKICDIPDEDTDCDGKGVERRQSNGNMKRLSSSSIPGGAGSEDSLNRSRSWDKIRTCKKWLKSNTYTVGGFVLTFIYNVV